jgi:membrane dipeptidase
VDLNAANPYLATRDWLRDWNVLIDSHPTRLVKVETTRDLAVCQERGRTGIILGFRNSDHFRCVEDVAYFHRVGQRVSQLTYNSGNLVGSGCTEPRDAGLTEFGVSVIREMNRVGMVVDVSHSGDCTTRDAIELSSRPVLVTHSNCRALNPHPRCKPDDAIRLLASKGGVFGVTGIRRFVRSHEPTTIEHVLDHFDHVARLVGVEHLGLGSDTDLEGRDKPNSTFRMDIEGLNHSHRVYELVEGLVRRRYSDRSIRLILGGNFQRALAANWDVAGVAS